MKNTQPQFYFSAYPLKDIGATAETNLKVSSNAGDEVFRITPGPASRNKKITITILPDTDSILDIEKLDVSWFNNYE